MNWLFIHKKSCLNQKACHFIFTMSTIWALKSPKFLYKHQNTFGTLIWLSSVCNSVWLLRWYNSKSLWSFIYLIILAVAFGICLVNILLLYYKTKSYFFCFYMYFMDICKALFSNHVPDGFKIAFVEESVASSS